MKNKLVRLFLVIFLLLLLQATTPKPNNSSTSPTPTIIQPTSAPTSILAATIEPASPSSALENGTTATIVKVVDGDTIQVNINGTRETVRIIGINTPETVDPRRPVECFGKEASDKAKTLLPVGKTIELEEDLSQDTRDRYNRLLRYVFIDGNDYGKQMISEGFAYEYTYEIPYRYQQDYKAAQQQAQENKRGLWADKACSSVP